MAEIRLGPVRLSIGGNGAGGIVGPFGVAPGTAEAQRKERPQSGPPIGATGTQVFGGLLLQQDYNADLVTPHAYDLYDQMRADGDVAALLRAIFLPIMSAEWTVEPATDDPQDVAIAEFLKQDLLGQPKAWKSTLYHVLLHLVYGSMPFEVSWKLGGDGLVHLDQLAPRLPKSIIFWYVDDDGQLTGIEQNGYKASGFQIVDIPASKLVVFVNDQEGSNYRGRSILRSAYMHWYYVVNLYKIAAIAVEKRALGVDVMKLGGEFTDDDRTNAESVMAAIHAHEKQYLVLPNGQTGPTFEYELAGIEGGRMIDPIPLIEHHTVRMLRSVAAEFIAIGTTSGSSGNRAVHQDKTSMFLMGERYIADYIADTVSLFFRQWCDYNWPGLKAYPTLHHSRLESKDILELAQAVDAFVQAGVLTPGRDVEEEVRTALDFPDLPEVDPADPDEQQQTSNLRAALQRVHHAAGAVKEGTPGQHKHMDFDKLRRVLDAGEAAILRDVRHLQPQQIEKLVQLGAKAFPKGPKGLGVTVPLQAKVAQAVTATLHDLYRTGRAEVQAELQRQGMPAALALRKLPDPADEDSVLAYLGGKAQALTSLLSDRLKSTWVSTLLTQMRLGEFDPDALRNDLNRLSDREITRLSGTTVSEALNYGRQSEALTHKDDLDRVELSSVLDENTCDPCAAHDGMVVDADDPYYQPPLPFCEGRDRCRCIQVYVYGEG